jgi:3-oxoacyl-[acyl-carrier-protein] synthase II
MLGQAVSASGVFQAAASCMTLQESIVPPTINQEFPDPVCDLDYVPNVARVCRVNQILMNAHGLGGTLSTLIIRRPDGI